MPWQRRQQPQPPEPDIDDKATAELLAEVEDTVPAAQVSVAAASAYHRPVHADPEPERPDEESEAHPESPMGAVPQSADVKVEREASPFERLYNVNPELFANMLARDFMERATALADLDAAIENCQVAVDILNEQLDIIDKAIEAREMEVFSRLNLQKVENVIIKIYGPKERMTEEEREALSRLEDPIHNYDEFADSVLSRCKAVQAALESYMPAFAGEVSERRRERDAFLDQFRIH